MHSKDIHQEKSDKYRFTLISYLREKRHFERKGKKISCLHLAYLLSGLPTSSAPSIKCDQTRVN